jgi:acyl carrier protein phosphodiesterase
MNWLAHLYLSEDDVEHRLGNILADVVKGKARKALAAGIQRGIRCHQAIDALTDYHPDFGRSQQRIGGEYRRFAGIVVDVFYDHFLAKNWSRFSPVPLSQFTQEIYRDFLAYPGPLPEPVPLLFERMAREDWLGGYLHLSNIQDTLGRISRRLKRPVDLRNTMNDLATHYSLFEEDFLRFFPELRFQIVDFRLQIADF